MGVRLHITGERALFMRPEFRHDRISYDLMTPHAARGILDAVYRRPGMRWVIDAIRILKPVQHEIVEQAGRRVAVLRDVAYLIDAHFELAADALTESAGRHAAMTQRALRDGVTAHLGSAEYPGAVRLAASSDGDAPPTANVDYGWLYYGPDFAGDRRLRFFRAVAIGGCVAVPPPDSPLLFG